MSPVIVLTATAAAAVLVSALTKSRRRNREGVSVRKIYAGRDSVEVLANNVKAAAKKVDNSAARVEAALKPLMAILVDDARRRPACAA
jgi:hypothetical protein